MIRSFACAGVTASFVAIVAGVSALSGCSGAGENPQAQQQPPAAPPTATVLPESKPRVGKPGAPVRLQFDQTVEIQPGTPATITVNVVPHTDVDHLQAEFRGRDGLVVLMGQFKNFGAASASTPLSHQLTVSAPSEGLYHLSALLTAGSDDNSMRRSASVAVVVGNRAKVTKARIRKSTPLTTDATGTRIKPLPVEEH